MQKIIQSFESGTPRWQLAEHYAISVTSVERARRAERGERSLTVDHPRTLVNRPPAVPYPSRYPAPHHQAPVRA
jgi:hypothetical protein